MAVSVLRLCFFFVSAAWVLTRTLTEAETSCSDCFVRSRAAYSNANGTSGACSFGSLGEAISGGDISAVSDLYRNGLGCGACYQVRCLDGYYCSEGGVRVVITDQGSGHNTDFILSRQSFGRMAQTPDLATSLFSLGVVDVEYRRVSCYYPGKNIMIKIDESSSNPHYFAFVILFQQGKTDITAVQLCENANQRCKLLERSYGAVWAAEGPPAGELTVRMLLSRDDGDETWVVPLYAIPSDWKPGMAYDTGVQVDF
ncbi:PREDICTED: expansin-like B1 [Tarenaya hassleriana]|uniref:expansin-like B1 n=1 Tax=Tarenaya hassleriana TaxID=28532 RepID=UPI00053C5814|nr:PREDICTED: expansin-like B1 [Tarenaya hassleriana]